MLQRAPFFLLLIITATIIFWRDAPSPDHNTLYPTPFSETVTVASPHRLKAKAHGQFKHSLHVIHHGKKSLLSYYSRYKNPRYFEGQQLHLQGKLFPIHNNANDDDFDYRRYLARKGVTARLSVRPSRIKLTNNSKNTWGTIESWRLGFQAWLQQHLSPKSAALMSALFSGSRDDLGDETREAFQRTGTAHLLSISGLHLALLSGLFYFLLGFIFPKRLHRMGIICCWICFYIFFTGAHAPVLRAGILIGLATYAMSCHRRLNHFNLLCFAACLILWLKPAQLFSPGFYLSFAAVFGIGLALWRFSHTPIWLKSVIVSISAWIFTAPIILYTFNTLNPLSIIYNIITVPIFSLFLTLQVGLLFLARLTNNDQVWQAIDFLAQAFLNSIKNLAAHDIGNLVLSAPPLWLILMLYLGLTLSLRPHTKTIQHTGLALVACVCFYFTLWQQKVIDPNPGSEISFLNVGVGDCTIVRSPTHCAVIDAGGFTTSLQRALLNRRIRHIDYLILTHSDEDHVRNALRIVRDFSVGQLIFPLGILPTPTILALTKQHPPRYLKQGDSLTLGTAHNSLTLHCLNPSNTLDPTTITQENENNHSLVFLLTHTTSKQNQINTTNQALLCADIEHQSKRRLQTLSSPPTPSLNIKNIPLLKAPHHGRNILRDPFFITHLQPQTTVINGIRDQRYEKIKQHFPNTTIINTYFTGEASFTLPLATQQPTTVTK